MAASGSIARLIRGAPAPPPPGNVTPMRDTLARAGSGLDEPTPTQYVSDAERDLERADRMGTDDLMQEIRQTINDADDFGQREQACRKHAADLQRILHDRVAELMPETARGGIT